MADAGGPERPRDADDLARIVLARAMARLAVTRARRVHDEMRTEAFRTELGATVRRVSPLLVAFLEGEGLPLDDVVWSIAPGSRWPFVPLSLSRPASEGFRWRHVGRGGSAHLGLDRSGVDVGVSDGGRIRIRVVDGGLEVGGVIGSIRVATSGHHARFTVPGSIPAALAHAAIDRPAGALVDLRVLAGRDWPVVAVETRPARRETSFVVETGSRPYATPWVRAP